MDTGKLPNEDALRECLERIVPEMVGRRSEILTIDRRRFEYSSFYACFIVMVHLATGDDLKLFLKDFDSYHQRPKDGMDQRRERELRVYRDLLAHADLGTAKYCGSVWDEANKRYWLLLEFVNGTPVRYCGFEYWVAAAGWLGRMHGYFARHSNRLHGCEFLLRHDAEFFGSTAELALRAVSQISPQFAERLGKVVARYHSVVDVMVAQPRTLVHGGYRPVQILVNANSEPLIVCPVDWELAAFGSPLYDFACFTDGFEPPELDVLWDAYRHEAMQNKVPVPDAAQMSKVVACFRLHRILTLLSQSVDRRYPEKDVAKILAMGESHVFL